MPVFDVPQDSGLDPVIAPYWSLAEFAKERMLKLIEGMTPEQLAQRPAGFNNSIATLVNHVAATEVNFSHLLLGRKVPDELAAEYLLDRPQSPLPQPEGETVESLTAKVEKARAILREALGTLRAGDLERLIDRPNGNQVSVRWLLTLMGYHISLHNGQMQMIKQHLG
jgi:uncharacterized damage-inducible protein DinB